MLNAKNFQALKFIFLKLFLVKEQLDEKLTRSND